jgi:predicted enzyme related to lactoylglutathione lyase
MRCAVVGAGAWGTALADLLAGNGHDTVLWSLEPDVAAAASFYEKLFGWKPNTMQMGPMEYTEFKLGDRSIGGAMKPPMEGMPAVWGIYFAVDDTDKAAEIAAANGGTVMQPPTDIPPGRMAVIVDPAGAFFSAIKMAQPGTSPLVASTRSAARGSRLQHRCSHQSDSHPSPGGRLPPAPGATFDRRPSAG